MAFRTWGRPLLTALGLSLLAGAGQLGIAFGFGVVRLTGSFTGGTVNQWPAQLAWVGWFAANAAVVGAVLAERLTRRDGPLTGTGRQLAVAAAAALGATIVAPLCMQPARAADLISVDPVWAVAICAVLGAAVGAGAALAVLVRPPLGWNVALFTGTVWLLALVSVTPSLAATGPLITVRLGVLEPSWLDAAAAQRLSLLVPPLVALLAGAVTGSLARWRGHPPLICGLTGMTGPVLLAFAYLTAGPGDGVDRYQATPYYGALLAVAAGALGSTAAALLRWPLVERPAAPVAGAADGPGPAAIEPTDILRPLPTGPALSPAERPAAPTSHRDPAGSPGTALDPTAGEATASAAGDGARTSAAVGDPAGGVPAASTDGPFRGVVPPAHWDWPASGGTRASARVPAPDPGPTTDPGPTAARVPVPDPGLTADPRPAPDPGTARSAPSDRTDAAEPARFPGSSGSDGAETPVVPGNATAKHGGTGSTTGPGDVGVTTPPVGARTSTTPDHARPTTGSDRARSTATPSDARTTSPDNGRTATTRDSAATGTTPDAARTASGPGRARTTASRPAEPSKAVDDAGTTTAPADTRASASDGSTTTVGAARAPEEPGGPGPGAEPVDGSAAGGPTPRPRRARRTKTTPTKASRATAAAAERATGAAPGQPGEAPAERAAAAPARDNTDAAAGDPAGRPDRPGSGRASGKPEPETAEKRTRHGTAPVTDAATAEQRGRHDTAPVTDAPAAEQRGRHDTAPVADAPTLSTPSRVTPTPATPARPAPTPVGPGVSAVADPVPVTPPRPTPTPLGPEPFQVLPPAPTPFTPAPPEPRRAGSDPYAAPARPPAGSDPYAAPARPSAEDSARDGAPRPRHRAPLPDLNSAGTWNAFGTVHRTGPTDARPTDARPTDARPADLRFSGSGASAGGGTTPPSPPSPPAADPAVLGHPDDRGEPVSDVATARAATGDTAPPTGPTSGATPAAPAPRRRGLFRRNRSRTGEADGTAETEQLPAQDEEFVHWVAGLAKPLSDNEPEQESGRRSLRSTGRHHAE